VAPAPARLRRGGVLADDMGLGKTLQTITHILAERRPPPRLPALVVTLTSVSATGAASWRGSRPT